jgi:hypothetical protein
MSVAGLVLVAGGLLAAASYQPRVQELPVPGANQRLALAAGDVWLRTPTGTRCLDLARYHPWKLAWARVAGRRQLAVGVHKPTRLEPHPHNTLFLYDWDHGRLSPRWLGSRLSKPFTDFVFADLRGCGETDLVSLERLRDGRYCLVIYRWTGFGFQGEWQSPPFERMYDLTAHGRIARAWVEQHNERRLARFAWLGDAYGELAAKEKRR